MSMIFRLFFPTVTAVDGFPVRSSLYSHPHNSSYLHTSNLSFLLPTTLHTYTEGSSSIHKQGLILLSLTSVYTKITLWPSLELLMILHLGERRSRHSACLLYTQRDRYTTIPCLFAHILLMTPRPHTHTCTWSASFYTHTHPPMQLPLAGSIEFGRAACLHYLSALSSTYCPLLLFLPISSLSFSFSKCRQRGVALWFHYRSLPIQCPPSIEVGSTNSVNWGLLFSKHYFHWVLGDNSCALSLLCASVLHQSAQHCAELSPFRTVHRCKHL